MSEHFAGFTPPAFQPGEALLTLRRQLRELGLNERGGQFERHGLAVARLEIDGGALKASVVQRPARSPEWQTRTVGSAAEMRDFMTELKKRSAGWSERDE